MAAISSFLHDMIIRASASTYKPKELRRINLSRSSVPGLVISKSGGKKIIEIIETHQSLDSHLDNWLKISNSSSEATLVIPEDGLDVTKRILTTNKIQNFNLQTYVFDSHAVSITFTKIN